MKRRIHPGQVVLMLQLHSAAISAWAHTARHKCRSGRSAIQMNPFALLEAGRMIDAIGLLLASTKK